MAIMKGNFETKRTVETNKQKEDDLESLFEKKASKYLGGSIAFVKKQQVIWDIKDTNEPEE